MLLCRSTHLDQILKVMLRLAQKMKMRSGTFLKRRKSRDSCKFASELEKKQKRLCGVLYERESESYFQLL